MGVSLVPLSGWLGFSVIIGMGCAVAGHPLIGGAVVGVLVGVPIVAAASVWVMDHRPSEMRRRRSAKIARFGTEDDTVIEARQEAARQWRLAWHRVNDALPETPSAK